MTCEKSKFPTSFLEYSGKDNETIYLFKETNSDVYIKEWIDDWIKRCREDFPLSQGGAMESKEYAIKTYEWFERWFSQFNDNLHPSLTDEET